MSQNYYELLGVSQSASFAEIKRAFRVKAKECHPDYHPGDADSEKKFKEINEAYEVLKDEQKRAAYDRYGHDAYTRGMGQGGGFGQGFGQGFGGFDFTGTGFENIFEEVFNGFGGRRRQAATNRGNDIRYDLTIDLADAYTGLKKNITVDTFTKCESCNGKGGKHLETCPTCGGQGHVRQRQGFFVVETECPVCHATGKTVKEPCSTCGGTGRVRKKRTLEVNIPAGVDTGVRMRLSGEGDAALNGGESGDLYVFLTVKEHPIFKRDGINLYCEVPVPMTTAALGGDILIPTMDGKGETVKIKPGLQTGAEMRLKGKGMPVLKSGSFGDLYVIFRVETPTNLTSRQKELLAEFTAAGQDNQTACSDFLAQIKKLFQ